MPPTLTKYPARCSKCGAFLPRGSLVLEYKGETRCAKCANLGMQQDLFGGEPLPLTLQGQVLRVEGMGDAVKEKDMQLEMIEQGSEV